MSGAGKGALFAGIAGSAVALAIAIIAVRKSVKIPDDTAEWFVVYATLWGAPLSLLVNLVGEILTARVFAALLLLSILVNWALAGGIVGWVVSVIWKRG